MMSFKHQALVTILALACGLFCPAAVAAEESKATSDTIIAALERELREAETAFAASFAEADMEVFASFLDASGLDTDFLREPYRGLHRSIGRSVEIDRLLTETEATNAP